MIQYSISDLEKITGIKAHTIRMWERRYDLIQPDRTKSNVRLYSQEDMQKLQDVVLLYNKGIKISQIAAMGTAERASMLNELSDQDGVLELRKDCFTASILEFNEEKLITLFDNYEKRHGFIKTLTDFVWPYIENSSLLYVSGAFNLAHENFVNQVIKRKIMAKIDSIAAYDHNSRGRVLIFLPPGEQKELYTAGVEYGCRLKGYHTLNMGLNIGLEELEAIGLSVLPDFVLTMIDTDFKMMAVEPYLRRLSAIFPDAKLVVCGHLAASHRNIDIPNLSILQNSSDMLSFFN